MNEELSHKSKFGQYFTKNKMLQKTVFKFIKNKPTVILEPSIGRGDLIKYISKKHISKNHICEFDMFEIDKTIDFLKIIDKDKVVFGDFLKQKINKKYITIIGNPPYVKTKKGNLYIDFIEKCFKLLESNGELIFIIPSDFFKLTSSSKLLDCMMKKGTFTHIYHPHDEKLFEEASIDVIVFRYCKNNKLDKIVKYNRKDKYIINSNGLITFEDNKPKKNVETFAKFFDVFVGMVSGKEEVYKNCDCGNIEVLCGKNNIKKYIYVKQFPFDNEEINKILLDNKNILINRKIRKFSEKNWFEWGAPRNIKIMENHKNEECIYIYNLTRNKEVAFKGKIMYFGGNLIMLKPKTKINLDKTVEYLNSDKFKKNFVFSGRFKIGHRQLSLSTFL